MTTRSKRWLPGALDRPGTDSTVSANAGGRHERPASGPRERRHLDRRVPGLAGTGLVADDLYLLGHDDRSGRPLLQPRAMGTGLAGALLAELMLAGFAGLRPDGAVVIARRTSRDTVLSHPVLRQVAAEPWPQPVRSWLRFLAGSAARDVALRLEAAGYLQHLPGRSRRGHGLWVPVNPDWAFAPMVRARAALDRGRPLTAHAGAVTGLAFACGLGFRLEAYQAQASRPVEDAVAQLGPGLRELIAQTQTAVDSAVLSLRT
jgi:Golgi phosphoprotein 3 (GPP34)